MAFPLIHPQGRHGATSGSLVSLSLVLRALRSAIGWVCGLVLVFAAVLGIVGSVSSNSSVMGHRILVVRSGSMTPTFRTGSIAIVRPINTHTAVSLHAGDIVTFKSAANPAVLITHRIVSVQMQDGSVLSYTTKGDANPQADASPLTPDRVVGLYSGSIAGLGYFAVGTHQIGFWLMLVAAFALAQASVALITIAQTETVENTK